MIGASKRFGSWPLRCFRCAAPAPDSGSPLERAMRREVRLVRDKPDYLPPYGDRKVCRNASMRTLFNDFGTSPGRYLLSLVAEGTPSPGLSRDSFLTRAQLLGGYPPQALLQLQQIFSIGGGLAAVGISPVKGGLTTLLNVMLDGTLFAHFYGSLTQGPAGMPLRDILAGPHGPFYVLLDPDGASRFRIQQPNGKDIGRLHHVYRERFLTKFLVPTSEEAQRLRLALEKAVQLRFLTSKEAARLAGKLQTYSEFLEECGLTPA